MLAPWTRSWARTPRCPVTRVRSNSWSVTGWPVITPTTGGAAVPQGPGCLQLSMLLPHSRALAYSLEDVYQLLCHPLSLTLGHKVIHPDLGSVADAFCDGRFNLMVGGRTISGTAQIWRAAVAGHWNRREGYVLAHASLFVDMNKRSATDAVNRFYDLAGGKTHFGQEAVTTVRDCLHRHRQPRHGRVLHRMRWEK